MAWQQVADYNASGLSNLALSDSTVRMSPNSRAHHLWILRSHYTFVRENLCRHFKKQKTHATWLLKPWLPTMALLQNLQCLQIKRKSITQCTLVNRALIRITAKTL